jgi:TIR domain
MASIFFSYSHKDETLRDQLQVHLAGLERQGLITSWHDRRITAGSDFGTAIDANLDKADVILLLISPDFISSNYCYNLEMTRALERHEAGQARVIPVILRPCHWQDLPFGKLLATPRDGKAITKWPNIDEAFYDVVQSIKDALRETSGQTRPAAPHPPPASPSASAGPVIRSSNLGIRKQFTDRDLDSFRHEGFEYIAKFFENSLTELGARNPDVEHDFRRIDANNFTAAAYRNGKKVCKGCLSVGKKGFGTQAIEYAMDDTLSSGMNEAVYAKADDQTLYFESLGMQSFGTGRGEKLSHQGAAELFWGLFIQPLQSRDR